MFRAKRGKLGLRHRISAQVERLRDPHPVDWLFIRILTPRAHEELASGYVAKLQVDSCRKS
jgi:hypothetical protein